MWQRRVALGWCVALLPCVFVAGWYWSDGPDAIADDYAQYLLHTRALAEGRSYTDIGYIYTEHNRFAGPQAQPPGIALTLYPIYLLAGPHPGAIAALMLASLAVFLVLAGLYFSSEPKWMGYAVAAGCGISITLLQFRLGLMSDPGFCALLWGAFLLADTRSPWSPRRVLALTACGVGALLYRMAAVPLIPAMALLGLVRFREQRWRPLVPLGVWSSTFLVLTTLLPMAGAVQGQVGAHHPFSLARIALSNLAMSRLPVFQSQLYPFPSDRLNDVYHVATAVLLVIGLVAWLRTGAARLLVFFAAFYVPMVVLLPRTDHRYFWPLFPLFVFGTLNGIRVVAPLVVPDSPRRLLARAGAVAGIVLAASALVLALRGPRPVRLAQKDEARELFSHMTALARQEPVRVVFFKPRTFAWETGIPAMPLFRAAPDIALAELRDKRVSHVVLGALGTAPDLEGAMRRLIESRPDLFVREFGNAGFEVYRVRRDAMSGAAAWCTRRPAYA